MNRTRLLGLTTILATTSLASWAQQAGTLHGRVTTQDGTPAESVSVGLKGEPGGATTNSRGEYVISQVRDGVHTIMVSSVGLKTAEKTVTITGGQAPRVDFMLAESTAELNEVIVNGGRANKFARTNSDYVAKMPLKNIENPQVYNTVTKELLTEQLVFTADDATRNVPGLQRMWEATGRSGDGGSYYAMRGFVVQSQLRNGLAGNVTGTIDAANLEKLEVIKGPSGTLYGSALTSYGGLLNRVTKKAYDTFGGEVNYSAGSYNFNRVALDLNTPLNQAKTILFRVNGAFNYEGSFQDVGFNRSYAVAPTLTIRPSDRLSITLDGELLTSTTTGKQLIFVFTPASLLGTSRADELPLDYRKAYTGTGLWQDGRSVNLFGQVNYQVSSAIRSSTNFTSSSSYSNGFGPYFYLTGNGKGMGQDSLSRADQSTRDSRAHLLEVQQLFNGDFQLGSLRNRVVLGFDFLHINNDQHFYSGTFDGAPINSSFNYGSFNGAAMQARYAANTGIYSYPVVNQRNVYSVFLSDVLNLTDRLNVLAAVRADRFANKGGLVGSGDMAYNQTAFSPKFGAVYQLIPEQLSVFANYQNSFSNRGFYQAFNAATGLADITTNAKLEHANQQEAGVKFDGLAGKLTATMSVYNIHVKNLIRTDPNPLAAAQYASVQNGEQVSRGVEVDVVANPFQGFNVVAGFSYNHSELTNATPDVEGRRPATAASPTLANLWLSYRLSNGTLKGLGIGAGGNYASDNMIQNSTYYGQFILPHYVVLNASAFYDQPHYRLSVKVDNLTDKHYWIGFNSINPQKLRSIIGSVAYKF